MLFLCKNKAAVRACAQITGKEHTMKKLETVLAVTAAMILALSAAGCSSSSDDDDNETGGAVEFAGFGKEFSHSFDGSLNKIVNASDLESDFSALTITVYSYEYPGSDDWWVNIDYGTSWSDDKLGKDNGTWNDDKKGWSWTITDAALIAKFKSNGIFIAGNPTATAKVTVSVPTNSEAQTPSDTDTSSGGNSGTENGDEDSTGDTGTNISVALKDLWSNNFQQLLSADSIKDFSKLTININNSSLSTPWWITISGSTTWEDSSEIKIPESTEEKSTEISDLSKYPNGIYIAGTYDENKNYSITVTAYK